MIAYEFCVLGSPVSQGNLSPVPRRVGTDAVGKAIWDWRRPRLVHQNAKVLHPWRQEVASVALSARGDQPLIERDIAVSLTAVFYFARPKSLHRRFTRLTKQPDADRLLRALGDALTGVVWADDAQVAELHVWKRYAGGALDPLGAAGTPRMVVRVQAQEEAYPKETPLFGQPDNTAGCQAGKPERRKASKPARLEVGF